jgi:hypothetical protein
MYFPSLLHVPDLDYKYLCFLLGRVRFKSNGTLLQCATKQERCSGISKYNDRVSLLLCCNMDGSKELWLLAKGTLETYGV